MQKKLLPQRKWKKEEGKGKRTKLWRERRDEEYRMEMTS